MATTPFESVIETVSDALTHAGYVVETVDQTEDRAVLGFTDHDEDLPISLAINVTP